MKILLIDDHYFCRQTFRIFLERHHPGSIVLTANSVRTGLKLIAENAPDTDIVITDWCLSDGFGKALINEAKTRMIPTLLISTDAVPHDHGADIFIPKMECERIPDAIRSLLQIIET